MNEDYALGIASQKREWLAINTYTQPKIVKNVIRFIQVFLKTWEKNVIKMSSIKCFVCIFIESSDIFLAYFVISFHLGRWHIL